MTHPFQSLSVFIVGVPLLYIIANEFIRYNARIKGIRGPAGLPLIGNIWDISYNAAEQYRIWSRKYGGVFQVQLGNIPIIVVNDAASAKTIFGTNSQALASRPELYTFHKVFITGRSNEVDLDDYQETDPLVGLVEHRRDYHRYIPLQRFVKEEA